MNDRYMLEHILVMEEKLGRLLYPDERVHHINTIRHDNRPENLELWSGGHPTGGRVEDLLAWAHNIIERYEPSHDRNRDRGPLGVDDRRPQGHEADPV
ncbi:HNH endonuclease [Rhodococcus sp. NPDC003994]